MPGIRTAGPVAAMPTSPESPTDRKPAENGQRMARLALGFSIFAFVLPCGIAALVLGHMADRRIHSEASDFNGKASARAALWIAYVQLALIGAATLILWSLFHETALGFQRDSLVQGVFRASDQMRPLDSASAREAETTARTLVDQLMAIEEQFRRHSDEGAYACTLEMLLATGLEGETDAEKRAFAERVLASHYRFAVSNCNPVVSGIPSAAYTLTAVPLPPRMPQGSAIFCADQTGVVRVAHGETSLDCLQSGVPIAGPAANN